MAKPKKKAKSAGSSRKASAKKGSSKSKPTAKKKPAAKAAAKKPVAKKAAPKKKSVASKSIKARATTSVSKQKPSLKSAPKKEEIQVKVKETTVKKPSSNGTTIGVTRPQSPKKHAIQQVLPEEANRARYSDKELEEFRKIILTKIDEARKELNNLTQTMSSSNEHGTDDTAGTFKMLEDGSESLAKEEAGQLAQRQKKFIEQLENAMVRIENKTYGICRVTGKLIPKERLRAVPHTTQSIEAKLNQYRD